MLSAVCLGSLALTGCAGSAQLAEQDPSEGGSHSIVVRPHPTNESKPTEPKSSAATGRPLVADGFEITLPPHWHDQTDYVWSEDHPVRLSLYRKLSSGDRVLFEVMWLPGTVLPSQVGSRESRDNLVDELTGELHGEVTDLPDIQVDDALAIGAHTLEQKNGRSVELAIYLPSNLNLSFPILLANAIEDHEVAQRDFQAIIESWKWPV